MTKSIKISVLWLLTICGFAAHSICDVLQEETVFLCIRCSKI